MSAPDSLGLGWNKVGLVALRAVERVAHQLNRNRCRYGGRLLGGPAHRPTPPTGTQLPSKVFAISPFPPLWRGGRTSLRSAAQGGCAVDVAASAWFIYGHCLNNSTTRTGTPAAAAFGRRMYVGTEAPFRLAQLRHRGHTLRRKCRPARLHVVAPRDTTFSRSPPEFAARAPQIPSVNRSRDRPSPLAWASHISAHTNYGCTSWNLRRGALLIIAVVLSADAQARWCLSLRNGGW
eukprot:scaffold5128_cov104-Isochrysis_galbana.AAC.6